MTSIKPSLATLSDLADRIAIPAYDPRTLRHGIVHLGLGNFHRAHMARYTHELIEQGASAAEWGIFGAGLMPGDAALLAALEKQDRLYTLVERGDGERRRLIGSLAATTHVAADPEPLLRHLIDPAIRIVSLTVTEHGYCLDPATKRLDPGHKAIVADLADPERPRSAIGLIVEAARRRMASGLPGFTAMSCDNIQHNGHVLRHAVADLAALRSADIADWIADHVTFPSTMVDRITPVTRAEDAADLAARHGVDDGCAVFCESFSQWVIEDDFAAGRPDWDKVGAQFVGDVAPYEFMKLRLLNASHLAISAPARLIGHVFIHEAMAADLLRRFMAALMERETGPTLLPVPGIDLPAYKASLIARFANPAILDTVERVNNDAALNYLLDPIRDRLRDGRGIDLLGFAVAAWIRRAEGVDETGAAIDVRHPLAGLLRARANEGGADPLPVLRIESLFGTLADDPALIASVGRSLSAIHALGTRAALAELAEEQGF